MLVYLSQIILIQIVICLLIYSNLFIKVEIKIIYIKRSSQVINLQKVYALISARSSAKGLSLQGIKRKEFLWDWLDSPKCSY